MLVSNTISKSDDVRVFYSYMMSVTSGAGTAYHSGAPEFLDL
jgi:hypothetical protein